MADIGTPLIEAEGLIKDYGTTHAVRGITFKVARGEIVGFLGPNGAGKSTTMKMLTGFLRPTGGTARINGVSVQDAPLEARRGLGYLPESAPMYNDMMVIDFLRFVAELRGVAKDVRALRIRNACERCGLEKVLGKDIGQLSKGFRQRVGLAQALLHDPSLLILDEPTSGLDPNQIVEIRALIRDLGRDKTVLLSTHILPEVQATCGRIIIINDGRLVADDSPEALTEKDAGAMIRIIVKGKGGRAIDREQIRLLIEGLPGVRTVVPQDGDGAGTHGFALRASGTIDVREALFDTAVSNQLVILDLHRERVSLEDTFRRLTRGDVANGNAGKKEEAHAS